MFLQAEGLDHTIYSIGQLHMHSSQDDPRIMQEASVSILFWELDLLP